MTATIKTRKLAASRAEFQKLKRRIARVEEQLRILRTNVERPTGDQRRAGQ